MEDKSSLIKRLMFFYNMMCDLMKIFEFLFTTNPDQFFNINSLNYSRFSNLLKNISSRIIEKHYLQRLLTILKKEKIGR
jgi:hypothetical protein